MSLLKGERCIYTTHTNNIDFISSLMQEAIIDTDHSTELKIRFKKIPDLAADKNVTT